jgi:hypothetical protein
MSTGTSFRSPVRTSLRAASIAAILSIVVTQIAQADDPTRIMKSMAEYLANQKSLSASFDSDIEIITPELQKIQFASSGQMKLSRPDKLRVRRTAAMPMSNLSMTAEQSRSTETTPNPTSRRTCPVRSIR